MLGEQNYGCVSFDCGIRAAIVSLTLNSSVLQVTALLKGPVEGTQCESYTIRDICDEVSYRGIKEAYIPYLDSGESALIRCNIPLER